MRKARVKDEGFRLVEIVDDAMQEAHEERCVEAHRARRVEKHDEAERLLLALPPEQLDRRAAVRDAAVDGAADVETAALPTRPLAPHEPCAHALGEAGGERVRLRDRLRIDDVADVGGFQRLDARRAFAARTAFAGCGAIAAGAELGGIGVRGFPMARRLWLLLA